MEQHPGRHQTDDRPWQKAPDLPRAPAVASQRQACHPWRIMSTHPTHADIRAASRRIAPHIRRTPVLRLAGGDLGFRQDIILKLELLQASGSFKPRGAFNCMLSRELPPAGVIAASGGNHGAAVAYAARALGVTAEIFVPAITGAAKRARIEGYGARLVVGGAAYDEARQASEA